jgi:hypothetical protein
VPKFVPGELLSTYVSATEVKVRVAADATGANPATATKVKVVELTTPITAAAMAVLRLIMSVSFDFSVEGIVSRQRG